MALAASGTRLRAVCVLALLAPLGAACGALPEDEAPAQYPPGQAVGTDDNRESDQAVAAYEQQRDEAAAAQGGQRESITIGSDDAVEGPQPMASDDYPDADPSALTDFRAALDPYGSWVDDPQYGTIWQPAVSAVGEDFAPYETGGHWTYGDDYTWVSDYSWGWAPFHYGRWVYATHGWGSIPGRQYAGAWTTWRTGYGEYAGYVGWAPLPPTYYWRNGVAMGIGIVPPGAFGFCRTGDLFASSLGGRMMSGPTVGAIGAHSAPTHGASVATSHGAIAGGGRTLAHPEVSGPSPASLRVANNMVRRPPVNNAGLNHARQFAHPSTAVALGAHAPAGWSGSRVAAGGSYRSSTGASAYGASRSFGTQTRTLGGGAGAFDRTYVGGHAISSYHGGGGLYGGGFHGGEAYSYGGGHAFSGFHGGGVHGGLGPAPQAHSPYYGSSGGGYHSSGGGGGRSGGHGGGHGGGHR